MWTEEIVTYCIVCPNICYRWRKHTKYWSAKLLLSVLLTTVQGHFLSTRPVHYCCDHFRTVTLHLLFLWQIMCIY